MQYTGLFFGSFNPIHMGHLMVAQSFLNTGNFKKIIFVVSPQNPFKSQRDLLPQHKRILWVEKAIAGNDKFEVSDIEFQLPKPNYTVNTVEKLLEEEPDKYAILMGADNLENLTEWKDIDLLSKMVDFFVYQRDAIKVDTTWKNVYLHTAPLIQMSATEIRKMILENKSPRYLLPESIVQDVIHTMQKHK